MNIFQQVRAFYGAISSASFQGRIFQQLREFYYIWLFPESFKSDYDVQIPPPPQLPAPIVFRGVVQRRSDYEHVNGGMYDFYATGSRAVFVVKLDDHSALSQYMTVDVPIMGGSAVASVGDHVVINCYPPMNTYEIEIDWPRHCVTNKTSCFD